MKYAVISYWVGEAGVSEFWLYDTLEDARKAMVKLWEQSLGLAREDDDVDEEKSRCDEDLAVVAWDNELYRYFEVAMQNPVESLI